jgi:hypothetical protein
MSRLDWLALVLTIAPLVATAAAQDDGKPVTPDLTTVGDAKSWRVHNAIPEVVAVDGKRAIRLTAKGDSSQRIAGLALSIGSDFTTGRIDVDLKGKNRRQESFLGVAFNVADETTFEAVYFRPFNFRADPPFKTRAVQYVDTPI